ncbi:MAG TPA: GNAT family N-acetyltransferase [Trueperaceae bacterium]
MPPLTGPYSYRELSDEEFRPIFERLRPLVFAEHFTFRSRQALSTDELEAMELLGERMGKESFSLRIGVYLDEEPVGWHVGHQEDAEKFYMTNTGIVEEHRGKGIYTALLPKIMERVAAEGFQIIYSRHNATNNSVLVPKLKAGFVISGLEINDRFGTLVHLSYFTNPLRRRMMGVRAGEERIDDELARYI